MQDYDTGLMLQFRKGDDAAFEKLVQRFKQKVVNIIYGFIYDKNEAEDLSIEVFLRVYQAAKRYKPRAKFSTWLYRITTNLCLNYLRKKRRHKVISLQSSTSTDEESPKLMERIAHSDPTPQEALEKEEKNKIIRDAIGSLSLRQRATIVLWMEEDLSYKQMAHILGCSVKSVERRLYWARKNLKEKLASYVCS
jgi:RNA polymerase sigma-70 factor (ECF subfamily)